MSKEKYVNTIDFKNCKITLECLYHIYKHHIKTDMTFTEFVKFLREKNDSNS